MLLLYIDMQNIRLTYKLLSLFLLPLLFGSCATIAGVGESGPSPEAEETFPYDQYVVGKPNLDLRVEGGCYIWREGNNWHVRFARKYDTPRNAPLAGPSITGEIHVRQALVATLTRQNISGVNDVRHRQRDIKFNFQMRNDVAGSDIEGFDFAVKPTGLDYCVIFDVLVDGAKMPGIVHLGSFMHIPDKMPLKICLHSFD